MARRKTQQPFKGQTFAFFGEFAIWPSYHQASPADVAARLGAAITHRVDDQLDCVVFGDLRGAGRAEAKKKAARLVEKGGKAGRLRLLDEAAYRELVRFDLKGKTFSFIGGFDCSPAGLDDGILAGMVISAGGKVQAEVDEDLDYLVVGSHRGPAKIATQNRARKLQEAGADLRLLDEAAFLELVRTDKPRRRDTEADFPAFIAQLYGSMDAGKLGRALDMLRTDAFKLYSHVDEKRLVGVVRSQSRPDSVYASWLTAEGRYGCSQTTLDDCMGLQGSPCKHLMVLIVGLVRTGQLKSGDAIAWARAVANRKPGKDTNLCAETFLEYKGAQAGEIDWRPTETIPEDYYAI